MKTEFEKKIIELGLYYQCITDDFYIFRPNYDISSTLHVQLICSEAVDERKYDSNNGNEIESIGVFKFKLDPANAKSDFIIFAFPNSIKYQIEFIIIPTDELNQRLTKENRTRNGNHTHKIVFWLMPDRFIYNCTDVGIEGEWYYLSKGLNGRMADKTVWNYTEFLNDWDRLKRI
jgi:hypothetical protein